MTGNKNYRRGRAKEYRIIQKLKDEGFDIAQRSSGSHSAVDVWAVRKQDRTIRLIQAKPKKFSAGAKRKLLQENEELNGTYNVEFVVQ